MNSLTDRVLEQVRGSPGLTDRELTNLLFIAGAPQQPVNQACRALAEKGMLVRRERPDGVIGNFPTEKPSPADAAGRQLPGVDPDARTEDWFKAALQRWLHGAGWTTRIAWGNQRGADIHATRDAEEWVIEVKGIGSRPEMRVNYFLAILGEILQRMDNPSAKFSIALPDHAQFRSLWDRLPIVAKGRCRITALFVDVEGNVREEVPNAESAGS